MCCLPSHRNNIPSSLNSTCVLLLQTQLIYSFSKLYSYLAKELQTRPLTKITLGSDTKSIKTLKESQVKTTHEVKRASSKKTSSLSVTSCQRPQGTEKPGRQAH